MPRQITQYRVFIGSPGGLDEERTAFRDRLGQCSKTHGEAKKVQFEAVGWEDTLGGCGRPQEQINRDLAECDYAVFVFHERWGSPTGKDGKVGTEEEWELAEKLWDEKKIRNIILFFKSVDPTKIADAGPQLEQVLAFRKRVVEGKRHLFHAYEKLDEFRDRLDGHLARWLVDHEKPGNGLSASPLVDRRSLVPPVRDPGHAFWIAEARAARKEPNLALYFSERAIASARSDKEWGDARNLSGVAKADLGIADEAIAAFDDVVERLSHLANVDERREVTRALFNKGVTLGELGRRDEAIDIYDGVATLLANATEAPLREQVAKALVNKGVALGELGRSDEAIIVFDDVATRFAEAVEAPLREQVVSALYNKGWTLGAIGRSDEAITVYDDVIAQFANATETSLREMVANALSSKGVTLGELGRSDEAIATFDDVVNRYSSDTEAPLRAQVATALCNKGVALGALGRNNEAIAVYDDVATRFGDDPALADVVNDARTWLEFAATSRNR